jgi:carbamoyl-phosphate synthase small subunit
MSYGTRGGNHPVKELSTGRVLITSQNHGFAVARSRRRSIPGAPELEVTHVNLNDGTIEGLNIGASRVCRAVPSGGSAGPHDGRPLFDEFMDTVRSTRAGTDQTLDT